MKATRTVSGQSSLEPAQITPQYLHLHVAPEIINTSKDCSFGPIICNFSLTIQLLPERMVVAYAIAALTAIATLPHKQTGCTTQEELNPVCPITSIAAVYYRPTEDRETQMTRHNIAESKDFQPLPQDWQQEVDISLKRSQSFAVSSSTCSSSFFLCGIDILVELASPSTALNCYQIQTPFIRYRTKLAYRMKVSTPRC